MVRTSIESVSLHCYNESSDKIYVLDIVEVENNNGRLLNYNVEILYGVRGKTLRSSPVLRFKTFAQARAEFQSRLAEKLGNGYQRVTTDRLGNIINEASTVRLTIETSAPRRQRRDDADGSRHITIGDL